MTEGKAAEAAVCRSATEIWEIQDRSSQDPILTDIYSLLRQIPQYLDPGNFTKEQRRRGTLQGSSCP